MYVYIAVDYVLVICVYVGDITVPDGMTFTVGSDLNGASPQFALTCISTGGPATIVTWTKDSEMLTGSTVLNDATTAQYTHTLTVTGRLGGLYKCTVSNDKPSEDSAQLNVQGTVVASFPLLSLHSPSPPAPSPPSAVRGSQNGLDSVLVSWTPPSGGPDVTGYIIYYQRDGGQRLSENAAATATTATITGLIAGATYSITMVATSSTLPSTETAVQTVTIGNNKNIAHWKTYLSNPSLYRASHHLPHLLSLLHHHGWRHCQSHLLCHSAYWSNW